MFTTDCANNKKKKCSFPGRNKWYLRVKRFAKRPEEAPKKVAACVLMTSSSEFGPKGPGTSYGLEPDSISDLIGDATAAVIEIAGVIKWFDVSKGFGFIVPDNGICLLYTSPSPRDS